MTPPNDLCVPLLEPTPTVEAWKALEALVVRAAHAAVASGKMPAPAGGWTSTSVEDLAQEFFARGSHHKVALAATDDQHLRRLVGREVRNAHIAHLRRTGFAALRERLGDVLANGDFVTDGEHMWRLPEQTAHVSYHGEPGPLFQAAFDVEATAIPERDDAKRSTSFASREDLERILTAVLTAAGAAVALSVLESVVRRRLGFTDPLSEAPLERDFASGGEGPDVGPDVADVVKRIWSSLERDQRTVLPFLDETVRSAMELTGLKRDKVSRVMRDTKALLAEGLEGLDRADQLAVVRRLSERQQRADARTDRADDALEEANPYGSPS